MQYKTHCNAVRVEGGLEVLSFVTICIGVEADPAGPALAGPIFLIVN